MPSAPARHHLPARSPRRGGFTFIEVMFAVMILAFGVIMIAIMIPVAIRQTQETRETNAGSAVVETGFHDIETAWAMLPAVQQTSLPVAGAAMPGTRDPATNLPLVVTFPSHVWNHAFPGPLPNTLWPGLLHFQTLGNRLSSSDARLAYIPFYSRDGTLAPQVAFVGVRARNVPELALTAEPPPPPDRPFFARGALFGKPDPNDLTVFLVADSAPLLVDVQIESFATSPDGTRVEKIEPDRVQFNAPDVADDPADPNDDNVLPLPPDYLTRIEQALVEGAALVVVNDRGQIRVLTLGPIDPSLDDFTWQLAPGGDINVSIDSTGGVLKDFQDPPVTYRGYLIGRMLKDPFRPWQSDTSTDPPPNPYVGPSQVVQVLEGKLLR